MVVLLTGCSMNLNRLGRSGETGYKFTTYTDYQEVVKDLSSDYFAYEQKLTLEGAAIESLTLGTVFEDIRLIYEERSDIEIKYFGVFSSQNENKEPSLILVDKGEATFIVNWKKLVGRSNGKMVVRLPKTFDKDLTVDAVSADVDADSLLADGLQVSLVSGDVEVSKMDVTSAVFNSVSGDIDIQDLRTDQIIFESTSGDIHVYSGDCGAIEVGTISGDMNFDLGDQEGDISLKSTSGDVVLDMTANSWLDITTLSGDISIENQSKTIENEDKKKIKENLGSGTYQLKIKTTSGDIVLR